MSASDVASGNVAVLHVSGKVRVDRHAVHFLTTYVVGV
jgi:hypothetical protein